MTITKIEHTNIPHTPEGIRIANEYGLLLRGQGAFRERKDNGVNIVISAEYTFGIKVPDTTMGEPPEFTPVEVGKEQNG